MPFGDPRRTLGISIDHSRYQPMPVSIGPHISGSLRGHSILDWFIGIDIFRSIYFHRYILVDKQEEGRILFLPLYNTLARYILGR